MGQGLMHLDGFALSWETSIRRWLLVARNQTRSQSPLQPHRARSWGAILFLAYINDLPENFISQVRLFADDTAVYLTIEGANDNLTLQNDLDRLSVWESHWDMEFNPSKCQVMQVTASRKHIASEYKLHGHVLETVTSAKYMGIDLSSNMSWGPHIDRITGNANKTLGFIKRNIKTKVPRVRELAYNALVRPQLEYAAPVWDPHT